MLIQRITYLSNSFCYKKNKNSYTLLGRNDYMNEIVSFKKEIEFKTMINEVTSISIEHTLSETGDNKIGGNLIISGTYKQTEASQIENPFSYKVPVDIEVDKKYDLTDLVIDIADFTYEVIDNSKLKINVDLILDKLKVIEVEEDNNEIEEVNDLFEEEDNEEKLEIPVREECENEEETNDSLFSYLDDSKETYKTYSIHIVKDSDTLERIMDEYKVDRETLEEYNNLDELKTGFKLIIPSNNENN